jgi:4-amino-4-deoxychorismate lyase
MFRLNDGEYIEEPLADSSAFCHGIGVYETIKLVFDEDECFIRAEYLVDHYRRLQHGIEYLGLKTNLTFHMIEQAISSIVVKYKPKFGAVKIIVAATKYPNCEIYMSYEPRVYVQSKYDVGFKLKISKIKRNQTSLVCQIKSISNLENMLELYSARDQGYDEVLYLNTDGYIAEGSISNVFWQSGRIIYTPSLECGILPGIMRHQVIERYRARGYIIREGMFELNDIYCSDRIFLTNSLLGEITAYLGT